MGPTATRRHLATRWRRTRSWAAQAKPFGGPGPPAPSATRPPPASSPRRYRFWPTCWPCAGVPARFFGGLLERQPRPGGPRRPGHPGPVPGVGRMAGHHRHRDRQHRQRPHRPPEPSEGSAVTVLIKFTDLLRAMDQAQPGACSRRPAQVGASPRGSPPAITRWTCGYRLEEHHERADEPATERADLHVPAHAARLTLDRSGKPSRRPLALS
jgi:hypothetical protein